MVTEEVEQQLREAESASRLCVGVGRDRRGRRKDRAASRASLLRKRICAPLLGAGRCTRDKRISRAVCASPKPM